MTGAEHYTFAQFWKCALQVNPHTYGPQYRGVNRGMDAREYAEALRDVCLSEQILVVGLADHGNVDDSRVARDILKDAGIVVFPGFEVTTTEMIHWVCLFPEDTTEQQQERYLGKLGLTNPEDGIRPSKYGGEDLLRTVYGDLGGFVYAAHIVNDKGVLKQKARHLWKDSRLLAAQIAGTGSDLPPEYKQIALNKNPDYQRIVPLALINAKDVAEPDHLRDPRASTLIKMTRPCFASFLMAFKDPESRVRLNDASQERPYSRIESISIEGGYFDQLSAEISGHLNAVIGGRGTGKSTLLECVRYALDVSHKAQDAITQGDEIVKQNLGQAGGRVILKLHSATNHMKPYTVIRRYGEPPRVIDEQGKVSRLHPGQDLLPGVEVYGQNEIHDLAKSPDALTKVLDRFLPDSATQQKQLDAAYRKLGENSEHLTKALNQKDEIETQIAELPKLEEQARQFKDQGLDEALKQVPLLEKERQLGPRITNEAERSRGGHRSFEDSLPDLVFLSDRALDGLPHAQILLRARQVLEGLHATLGQKLDEIDGAISEAETKLNTLLGELATALDDSEHDLEREFSKLPAVAGRPGKEVGLAYQRLLRDIEQVEPSQTRLKIIKALIDSLEQERRNLLGEISDCRSARVAAKQKAVKSLNKRLAGELRITLAPDGLRQPLRDQLKSLPNIGEATTKWVEDAENLTVFGLVAAVREGKDALLKQAWGLTAGIAGALERMTAEQIYELEAIDLQDRINLELNVSHTSEQYRPLERLSTGQQCTAVLHLLLLDNPDPLIMDQPEDNLDNAFIAERIVQELRAAKTERQFLFATHNANIPVFGDAEWIGVCAASEDGAKMPADAQGSIDIPQIRDDVASILEGGKAAFMQRKAKYGFDY